LHRLDDLRGRWRARDPGASRLYSSGQLEGYALARAVIERRAKRLQDFIDKCHRDDLVVAAELWGDANREVAAADQSSLALFLKTWPIGDPDEMREIRSLVIRLQREESLDVPAMNETARSARASARKPRWIQFKKSKVMAIMGTTSARGDFRRAERTLQSRGVAMRDCDNAQMIEIDLNTLSNVDDEQRCRFEALARIS
jgi:hypothetical protein